MTMLDRRVCIAPMMNHTDRHFRYLMRLLSRRVMLYTEMITTGALLHGNAEKWLRYNPEEHPLAVQLGGSNPGDLARCARLAADRGYDEINLNVGCPSGRVQSGRFGACLMAEPQLVAECISAMRSVVDLPVTVKCRIGIDNDDTYESFLHFVKTVADGGCRTFIVHARKAILRGLSPKQNREAPPLKYEFVHRIKKDIPGLEIILNGGVTSTGLIVEHLQRVDGVMLGRAVRDNPYLLIEVEKAIYNNTRPMPSRNALLQTYMEYAASEHKRGTPFSHITRHSIGLYYGLPGARNYRRRISELPRLVLEST
jgi:tRNA-dihydrouridine synthase A